MSSISSAALVDSASVSSEQECAPSHSAKSSPTAEQCSPNIGLACRVIPMFASSNQLDWVSMSTSSAEASPARILASLAMALASPDLAAGSGANTSGSSPKAVRRGSSSKTSAPFALEDWSKCSGSSLRSGMTRSGIAYPLQPLALLTKGTASGSSPTRVPTPTSRDWKDGSAKSCANVPMNCLLGRWVHMYPTPTWRDSSNTRNSTAVRYRPNKGHAGTTLIDAVVPPGGVLNPAFSEWLMGFPVGWTALSASEMPSSRKSRKSSVAQSRATKPADAPHDSTDTHPPARITNRWGDGTL